VTAAGNRAFEPSSCPDPPLPTLARALLPARVVLTAAETLVLVAALWAVFGLGREALAPVIFGLSPVLAMLVAGYLRDQQRCVRRIDALAAKARGAALGAVDRVELAEALVAFPRRIVRTRLVTWLALAAVLAAGCVAFADESVPTVLAIAGTCLCNASFFLLIRAQWFRAVAERCVLPALPGADPARYAGRTLRGRLFAASLLPAGVAAVLGGLYDAFFLEVPVEQVHTLLAAVPLPGALLVVAFFLPLLFRHTSPVRAWLAGRLASAPGDEPFALHEKGPSIGTSEHRDALRALQAATALPYVLAGRMFLLWIAAAAALGAEHARVLGPWQEGLLVFAGLMALAAGAALAQIVWIRAILGPIRELCAQGAVEVPAHALRPRLSLRVRLLAALGMVLFAAIVLASSTLYMQQRSLVAEAAGDEAREALEPLLRELEPVAEAPTAERVARLSAVPVRGTLVWIGPAGVEWTSAPLPLSREERREIAGGWREVRLRTLRRTLALEPLGPGATLGLARPWRRPEAAFGGGLVLLVGVLAALCVLLATMAARELTAPLRELGFFARRLGRGELDAPVPVPDPDEIGELARTLDWMRGELRRRVEEVTELNLGLERKVAERTRELERALAELQASRAELVHAEKMASVGRLAAGVAHEINNPLNFMANSLPPLQALAGDARAVLELLSQGRSEEAGAEARRRRLFESLQDVDDLLRLLRNGTQRTQQIVRGLRDFSRRDDDEPVRPVDVAALVDETLAMLRHELKDRVEVVRDLAPDSTVPGRAGALAQVLLNLVANAAQAIPGKGTITVATRRDEWAFSIVVRDTGSGIAPEVLPKIFEPFFTTREVGRGTGLGLAIVHGIVERHGGRIRVRSEPGLGTEFTVELPAG